MTTNWKDLARATLEGSESGTMTFPHMPNGETIELETEPTPTLVAESFDASVVRGAIREAQALLPGYTYKGFCAKVAGAGCAGYVVSLLGKRVLYYGRTGETHTEYFPGTQPAAKF